MNACQGVSRASLRQPHAVKQEDELGMIVRILFYQKCKSRFGSSGVRTGNGNKQTQKVNKKQKEG